MTGASASTGRKGTYGLSDVFSKAFSVFGRHIVEFFLLAVLTNLPAYVARFDVAQLATRQPTVPYPR
jgi:hypothetical protein